MKQIQILFVVTIIFSLTSCRNKLEEKGFAVSTPTESETDEEVDGVSKDSLKLETRPSNVLLTGNPQHRLTTIYRVNYDKRKKTPFIGSNYFHVNYQNVGSTDGNEWHYNFMPGIEAVTGYNMVNISHYNVLTGEQRNFFEKPVLIKTLYYPTFSKDTLNFKPILRNYYLVSVYDEDTNGDHFINVKDLRRFYLFDSEGTMNKPLVPKNYSVYKSEYDPANDFMYVFAQVDENSNGQPDDGEVTHIFWIDLKDPNKTGRQY